MAEWSKATDCKSVRYTHAGSNPVFFIFNTKETKIIKIKFHITKRYSNLKKIKKIKNFQLLKKIITPYYNTFFINEKVVFIKNYYLT